MATMAFRLAVLVLVVSIAAMAMLARAEDYPMDAGVMGAETDGHGLVSDALELDEELLMESESARRQLKGHYRGRGHISYGALRKNNVPCNKRGYSYYNCHGHQKANPYRRGCTRATRCARNNH